MEIIITLWILALLLCCWDLSSLTKESVEAHSKRLSEELRESLDELQKTHDQEKTNV